MRGILVGIAEPIALGASHTESAGLNGHEFHCGNGGTNLCYSWHRRTKANQENAHGGNGHARTSQIAEG
jgi:hypothetical protein